MVLYSAIGLFRFSGRGPIALSSRHLFWSLDPSARHCFQPETRAILFPGDIVGSRLALLMSGESSAWEYGFFSYCGGLVGLALASSPEKFNWRTILMLSVLSCFLTIAADQFLRGVNLPVLSLPYVLSMWIAVLSRVPESA